MKRSVLAVSGVAGVLALASQAAMAQAEGTQGNSFTITPYFWGASLDGKVSPSAGGPTANISAGFSDIQDQMDTGYALGADARWGQFGLLGDYNYLKLSDNVSTPVGGIDWQSKLTMWTLAPYWRFSATPNTDLDIYAGLRQWSADNTLDPTLGAQSFNRTKDWTDYLVGARVRFQPGEHWYFKGLADYGAGDSDSQWQAYAAGGYQFDKMWSAELGYRAVSVDYSSNSFLYDVTTEGYLAGIGIRF